MDERIMLGRFGEGDLASLTGLGLSQVGAWGNRSADNGDIVVVRDAASRLLTMTNSFAAKYHRHPEEPEGRLEGRKRLLQPKTLPRRTGPGALQAQPVRRRGLFLLQHLGQGLADAAHFLGVDQLCGAVAMHVKGVHRALAV